MRKSSTKKKKASFDLKNKLNSLKIQKEDTLNKEEETKKNSKNSKNNNNKNKNNLTKNKNIPAKKTGNTKKRKRNRNKNTKNNKKKNKRSFWKKFLTAILIMGITIVIAIAIFFGYIVLTAPEFDEQAFNTQEQTIIYDINGDIIAKLGTQKRENVSYGDLPQVLIDAIIATEDSRFFQHNGVDLLRFIKATFLQLMGNSDAGGASTITMQAVKNNLTKKDAVETSSIEKIIRKFQDVYLAVFKVEKEYTKETILEFYVNDNYLGGSAYGVEEASKYYFGKSVNELTLPEAALLAGLFQLPGANNPYKNPEGATARRNLVLTYMYNHGYITATERDLAKEISVESLLVNNKEETSYQGYIDMVADEVEELTGHNPYTIPMKIYTTMEKSIQDGVNRVLENDASYWIKDTTQAGIAIVNVETGAVAAIGAGRNRTGERTFNRATDALRQPGSTAKPIFAYGPGIEYNNFSSYTMFVDEPWGYTNGPQINNWDGQFKGIVTTRYALQYSRNIPALKAYQTVGGKKIQQFANNLGLDVSLNSSSENYRIINKSTGLDNTINEAYSIGGVAEGYTPLQMAAAYSAFASGGYYTKPYSVTKIEYRETGETIEYKASKTRVMKNSTAYIMNNILESAVTSGFDGGARVNGSHVAAKTGTTNFPDSIMKKYKLPSAAVNDLWTIAYTTDYSVAVWYGYDEVTEKDYSTNSAYKNRLMADVIKYIPKATRGWSQPSSVVAVQVEKESYPAKLPSAYTPENMITTEYFVRGTQPTETSERYAQLNDITKPNVVASGNTATITWEYLTPKALTDEYLQKHFSQSVFGKSSQKLLEERKKYNTEVLGDVIFGIYKENPDGTMTLVNHTNNLTYTYTGTGKTTLIIVAEHSIYKTNASAGTKLTFDLASPTPEPTPGGNEEGIQKPPVNNTNISLTLNGTNPTYAQVGNYKESGIKSIYYGVTDVTKTATIQYQIINGSSTVTYNTENQLVSAVNKLNAGTYKINYIAIYNNKRNSKPRTITLN